MSDNQYLDNLKGSPYINESGMDYLKKIKTAGSNFINKFRGSPAAAPTQLNTSGLTPQENDFVKIVETVCDILVDKINKDLKVNHDIDETPTEPNQPKPTPSIDIDKNYRASMTGNKTSITEKVDIDDMETSDGKSTTKLYVADTEDKAGGWLNWFRGQYRKSVKFGISFTKEAESKTLKMSNGKIKRISVKWANNNHENKILVEYEDVSNEDYIKQNDKNIKFGTSPDKFQGFKAAPTSPISETEGNQPENKTRSEIILFKFYDDQLNPKSPSFDASNPPTIGLLLHQANRYSKIIDKILKDKRLEAKSPKLISALYHVIQQKWKEFKGHKVNPSDVNFKLDSKGNIKYTGIDGELHTINPAIIESIVLGGEESTSADFINTGLSFTDFIEKLKSTGFKAEYLKSEDAKKIFNGDISGSENPNIADAVKALTTLGWSNEKATNTIKGVVSVIGNDKATDLYVQKALAPNKKPTPTPSTAAATPTATSPTPLGNAIKSQVGWKEKYPHWAMAASSALKRGVDESSIKALIKKLLKHSSPEQKINNKYIQDKFDKLTSQNIKEYKLRNIINQ